MAEYAAWIIDQEPILVDSSNTYIIVRMHERRNISLGLSDGGR